MEITPFLSTEKSKLNTERTTTHNSDVALSQSSPSAKDLQEASTGVNCGVMNSFMVTKALALMTTDFESKLRKVPAGWPDVAPQFISHLFDVATKLAAWGYDEEVVAAGLLHDAIEDLPKLWDKARITSEFSPRVADLVDWVTQQNKSLSWEARNEAYSNRLHTAPPEAVAISMADKISNISSTLPILRAGYPLTTILKRGWELNSVKFHELESLFNAVLPEQYVMEYSAVLQDFDRMAAPLEQ